MDKKTEKVTIRITREERRKLEKIVQFRKSNMNIIVQEALNGYMELMEDDKIIEARQEILVEFEKKERKLRKDKTQRLNDLVTAGIRNEGM